MYVYYMFRKNMTQGREQTENTKGPRIDPWRTPQGKGPWQIRCCYLIHNKNIYKNQWKLMK